MFGQSYTHHVTIKTGDKKGAGTDANIFISLTDENGETTEDTKLDIFWRDDFEKGAEDSYKFTFRNLGKPTSMKLSRDLTGSGDGWYVQYIMVESNSDGHQAVFPINRWINASTEFSVEEFDSCLPQDSQNREQRRNELDRKRSKYELKTIVEGTPRLIATFPEDENFSLNYQFDLAQQLAGIVVDNGIISFTVPEFESLADFKDIYVGFTLTTPNGMKHWKKDEEFGNQRVAGVNPFIIELCKKIPDHMPVKADILEQFLEGHKLQQAIDKKKIYMVDLRYLADIECRDGRKLPGPTALFYSKKNGDLIPIAIQLMPEPFKDNPIFTPENGELENTWLAAKMWFNMADASHHQSSSHLGLTHLVMETVAICTHRQLSPSHPIFKLLAPHFLYLLAINNTALGTLVNEGGFVDEQMYIGRQGMYNIIRRNWKRFNIQEYGNLKNDLKRRGVDDTEALPNYPYRDDALLLWEAIEGYVEHVDHGFYDTKRKLLRDSEVQAWAAELSDRRKGDIKGVPETFKTNEELIEVVTWVIFTASVTHAAANFGQYDEYGFTPNYPAKLKGMWPTSLKPMKEEELVAMLPDKQDCLNVMSITKLLSTNDTNELANFEVQYAYDPVTMAALDLFKNELEDVAETIEKRNKMRKRKYPYLHPTSVPNAISI